MNFLITLLFFFLFHYSHAKELITTAYSTTVEEKYELGNGTVHTNLITSGMWTDNFGNYGKNKCFGLFTTYMDKSINLNMKCETIDHNGNKSWSVINRESNEFDAGVGVTKYEDGTGPWKYLIGTECKYGIKYFEEASYSVEKCKISEKAYKEFSKN
tara:strand:+ start:101 stop:571 length:471 start_codon:yes stop_codon:yes gene_type:complete